jgi:hypothetical protein
VPSRAILLVQWPPNYLCGCVPWVLNLLIGMSHVVVHEWTSDLNISLENLSFQILGISIMMHYHGPQMVFYVPMI